MVERPKTGDDEPIVLPLGKETPHVAPEPKLTLRRPPGVEVDRWLVEIDDDVPNYAWIRHAWAALLRREREQTALLRRIANLAWIALALAVVALLANLMR